jgi:NAD(P) transhydrogenase subunit beta
MSTFIQCLYVIAFALFIYGLMGLTGPKTAVRGNQIAAVGMAIAVIATLLTPGLGNWWLIVLGVAIGAAVGVPAARKVKMTAMPQMVALFNGVGGGAVALIAWVEFRQSHGFTGEPAYVGIASLFAAVVARSAPAGCRFRSTARCCWSRLAARSGSSPAGTPSG